MLLPFVDVDHAPVQPLHRLGRLLPVRSERLAGAAHLRVEEDGPYVRVADDILLPLGGIELDGIVSVVVVVVVPTVVVPTVVVVVAAVLVMVVAMVAVVVLVMPVVVMIIVVLFMMLVMSVGVITVARDKRRQLCCQ